MKELIKIVSIFVLALFYCLEVSTLYNNSSQNLTPFQDNKSYVTSVSLNLLGSASGSENLVVSLSNTLATPFKVLFKSYIKTIKTTQQIFAKEFTQYTSLSKNFQVLFQKTTLIFPFNYFW